MAPLIELKPEDLPPVNAAPFMIRGVQYTWPSLCATLIDGGYRLKDREAQIVAMALGEATLCIASLSQDSTEMILLTSDSRWVSLRFIGLRDLRTELFEDLDSLRSANRELDEMLSDLGM